MNSFYFRYDFVEGIVHFRKPDGSSTFVFNVVYQIGPVNERLVSSFRKRDTMATRRSTSESEDIVFDEKTLKLSEIKAFFVCTICSNLLSGTSTTVCGHRYCAHCIQNWFQRKKDCPVCNRSLRNHQEVRDHQFDDLLKTIKEKAVSTAEVGARYVLETSNSTDGGNGNRVSHPIDQKMAEVLCVLLPQKDRDLKDMVEKLIAEKDKVLQIFKEKELPQRDRQIEFYRDQCKKLEEEAKLLRPLPEKMEKFRQLEAKLNGEKHQLEEKIQRLQGELTTLRTDVVTRQQREKELYGQLQHQAAEIKHLEMVSDEKTKAAAICDSLKKTVKQLEKDLQRKTSEAAQLGGFVVYKELFDQKNQEAFVLQECLKYKESIILEMQQQLENRDGQIIALTQKLKETPLSHKDVEIRYNKQLQKMEEDMEKFYERKSEMDKRHTENLAKELAEVRSAHLEDQQRMHDENMKLRKSFETQNNIPNWNSVERCTQLEASLNYYKNKVHELEERLTISYNKSNSCSP